MRLIFNFYACDICDGIQPDRTPPVQAPAAPPTQTPSPWRYAFDMPAKKVS
jgi:hypothetical protein